LAFFRKKPTESQLELIVLRASVLAKAQEIDTQKLATDEHIKSVIAFAFEEAKLKPDTSSVNTASISVQALLSEGVFLDELLKYQMSHPREAIPVEFRDRMLETIEKTVNEFRNQ